METTSSWGYKAIGLRVIGFRDTGKENGNYQFIWL